MKLSLNIGSREFSFGIGKSASTLAWQRGDDASEGGAALMNAYQQSVWVYACVSALAEQVAQIPFRFSRVDAAPAKARTGKWRKRALGEDMVESGPVVDLFARPHPQLTRFQFWELAVSWLQLRSELFCVPVEDGRNVTRLIILSPDQFREEVRANVLLGWHYTGFSNAPLDTQVFLPEELVADRLANPYNFWRGMSPLDVARLAAQTDYASAQFQKGLMLNNADTGVIVHTDQQASEEQQKSIMAALLARKRKAGTADRPLFLFGGAKVEKPTLSATDMQFLENRKFNRQEICAVFKVPQEVLGFTEDANRSVGESARLNFIENRVAPLCERLEAAFEPLIKRLDPGLYGWFDLEALPIMQSARRARYTSAQAAFSMGVPVDDCSEIFDLGLPNDLPHAGKSYLPFSLQEVGQAAPEPTTPPPAEPQQNILDRADSLIRALAAPQSAIANRQSAMPHVCAANPEFEASIAGSIKAKTGVLKKFFFEQRGRVLAALAQEVPQKAQGRSLGDIFDKAKEDAALIGKMKARLIADLQFGGAQLFKEIGLGDFNLKPTAATAFLSLREPKLKDINATTQDKIIAAVSEGLNAGEGYNEVADRVKAIYNLSDARAGVIALTETNTAVNAGRYGAMADAGVQRKGWQTSNLENTRQSHLENQTLSQTNNGILLDAQWPNGCLFPGDPEGDPGETINCRCFGYAVIGKSATPPTRLLRYEEFIATKEAKG